MLELPSRGATHLVYGTRFEDDRDELAFAAIGLEAHTTGCGERDAEDDLELGYVAMPTNWSADRVFGYDGLEKGVGREIGKGSGAIAERKQEFGDGPGGGSGAGGEVVFPSVFDDATFCGVALKLEWMKFELANDGEEIGFFDLGEECR